MSAFSPLQPQPQNDDIIDLISSDEEEQQQQQQQVEIHQYECWICEVPLCNPISTSRNLQVSCYAVHTHPTLKVPVCCVCSDQVTANLLSQKENAKEENELCSVCARVPEKDLLFLCDNPSCESFQSQEEEEEGTKLPQQICAKCVTQRAKPMIDPHLLQTQLLHQEVSWHCICCNPTKSIQLLQLLLESISSESSTSTASIEDILGDLETVEAKKRDCEELLEHEDDYRDEIKQELLEEEQVDAEFTEWKTLQMHHYTRLCDMITKLQEDAERLGFNLKEHYLSGSQHQQSLEAEPLWKQEADQACRERERQERKCPPVMRKQSPHPNEQALLLYNVDDLGSLSSKSESEEEEEERAQWRSAQHRVPHWQLQEAMQEEDDLRASLQMKKPSTIPERLDVDALKEEDYKASKVRTDSLTILRNCHKTKSKQKRPPQIIAKTNNNTPTCSPVLRHAKSAFSPPKKRSRSTAFRRINSHTFKSEKNDTNVAAAAATTMEQSSSTQQLQVSPEVLFDNSNCVLSTNSHQQTVSVATSLAAKLKPHQKEGIQFMFDNSFQDLANPQEDHSKSIGGCILAHNMGLGKSLSCVALIHTLFYHPVLTASYQNKIQTVILVVPVNTLVNWENEVDKWTKDIGRLRIINLAERTNRERAIEEWDEQGGILLTSDALFRSVIKRLTSHAHFLQKTNVIILDEAHIMLKNKTNEVFKALTSVQTKRRICLTGSPFQNNLFEFFRMASYIRPGVLGISERTFEGNFVLPILSGMTSDASAEAKERADRLLKEIQESLAPFVQRKDASVLLKDLPPMQQVVLSIRPTRVQSRLYGAYKRYQRASNDKDASNFFKMYSTLRSVHNHPGTLLLYRSTSSSLPSQTVIATPSRDENALQSVSKEENDRNLANIKHELLEERLEEILPLPHNTAISPAMSNEQEQHNIIDLISDSEEESSEEDLVSNEWWTRAAQKSGLDQLEDICSGNKVVLLLHILCHASLLDEKVVLFSQCLKTLDFISDVLSQSDWPTKVPSLTQAFPTISFNIGNWKLGKEFLRMDGQTSACSRFERITQFSEESVKLFLISSRAGGIGINLCSANRVILFDSNFNPTIDMQALYRCYRYGQTRNVFCYRFLTEGTIEQKVYSRAVNKSSLALSLVDGKTFQRVFSSKETADLSNNDDWVACERCNQWRMFPPNSVDVSALPNKWYCEMMNEHDTSMQLDCSFAEKDALWYSRHFVASEKAAQENDTTDSGNSSNNQIIAMSGDAAHNLSDEKKERLAARDEILTNLLNVSSSGSTSSRKQSKIVSQFHFHDALLDEKVTEKVVSASSVRTAVTGTIPQQEMHQATNETVAVAVTVASTSSRRQQTLPNKSPFRKQRKGDECARRPNDRNQKSDKQPTKKKNKGMLFNLGRPQLTRKLNFATLWAGEDDEI